MNMNDFVHVTLTGYGRKVIANYISAGSVVSPREWSGEWQLWRLMQVFGPALKLSSDVPFEKNEIRFERGES